MAKRDHIERQLREYSATVSAAVRTIQQHAGNWPLYAAATGSALAMATNASASILYSGPQNISVSAPGGPIPHNAVQPIDLDGPPHNDILNLRAGSALYPLASTFFQVLGGSGGSFVKVFDLPGSGSLLRNFALGDTISSTAGVIAKPQGVVKAGFSTGSTFGNFTPGVSGIAGLAIQLPGGTEFGWIRLLFTNGGNGLPQTLTAVDWAIEETAGVSITAGDTGVTPTPEPGTMALGLLASGAAGILAWKRRRAAAKL